MDASAIVFERELNGIISYNDLMMIRSSPNRMEQNEILHRLLRRKCTKEALMTVCELIIDVRGNPLMRPLGEEMKGMLEGKCSVCSCTHVYVCMHV